jgi:hypothetical protein
MAGSMGKITEHLPSKREALKPVPLTKKFTNPEN